MQKIIIIGECTLDVVFPDSDETRWPLQLTGRPAGRLFNAAAILGATGHQVSYVSEAADDHVGNILVDYLASAGVDTHCIDRFSDGGVTASNFLSNNFNRVATNRHYPSGGRFDTSWPRIDADDVVVFGGFFAIDSRTRPQVMELVNYAVERKAIIVYIPGFVPSLVPRITLIMPAILENLEVANIVITRSDDLRTIFDTTDAADCYKSHIRFYCRTMLDIDPETGVLRMFHRDETAEAAVDANRARRLDYQSSVVAGLISRIVDNGLTRAATEGLSQCAIRGIVDSLTENSHKPTSAS